MDKPTVTFCAQVVALALALTALAASLAAEHAHAHGVVQLNVAIEAGTIALQLEAPLDSLVGFEHAPRTAEQKQAVQQMFELFKAPQSLFGFAPAAQCALKSSSAESDALMADGAKPTKGGDEHADLDGSFVFDCKQLDAVDAIDLSGLLAAFPRISRIDAIVLGPRAQLKRVLKRPEKILRWGR